MDKLYSVKKFKTWDGFKKFVNQLSEDWVFRGQSNSKWELTTSLERTTFYKNHEKIEQFYLTDFQRGAKNYLDDAPQFNEILEWLAIMQHHGAATRLIDFTRSPYIASYFAYEKVESEEYVSVWTLNIKSIQAQAEQYIRNSGFLVDEFKKSNGKLSDEIFTKIFFINDFFCVFGVEPFNMNKRYFLHKHYF